MKIQSTTIYFFTALSLSVILASCQKNSSLTKKERKDNFNLLLKKGRTINHAGMEKGFVGFNLAKSDSNVINLRRDKVSDAISLISFDTDKMPGIDKKDIKKYALKYLEENKPEYKIETKNLIDANNDTTTPNGKIYTISYLQQSSGIMIRDSYVELSFTLKNGKYHLREIINRTAGNLVIANDGDIAPSPEQAMESAGVDGLELIAQQQIIQRKPSKKGLIYVKATKFIMLDPKSGESFTLTVEHGDFEIIEAYSNRIYEKPVEIKAKVFESNYLNKKYLELPLSFTKIISGNVNYIVKSDGTAEIGDNDTTVTVELSGPRAEVYDLAVSNAAPVSFQAQVKDNVILIDENQPQFDSINTYVSAQRINTFVRRHLKASQTPLLNRSIGVGVNTDGACNAFYDGQNIFLFAAGTQGNLECANMAKINDVLYHEWGHGLDDAMGRIDDVTDANGNPVLDNNGNPIKTGITDGAFSEGIGDTLAAYYTNNDVMARGFILNSNNGIRTVKNTNVFPDSLVNEVHTDGLIIGGAFWDMRLALIERYGKERGSFYAEELFINHLLTTNTFTESYLTLLRLDDDDGNPATRSPNFCLINKAFSDHGLAELEANCEDPQDASEEMIDEGLFLAIGSKDGDKFKLLASSKSITKKDPETEEEMTKKAARIELCLGELKACLTKEAPDLSFKFLGSKDDVSLFESEGSIAIEEQKVITIIAKDGYGKVIGARPMKFVSK